MTFLMHLDLTELLNAYFVAKDLINLLKNKPFEGNSHTKIKEEWLVKMNCFGKDLLKRTKRENSCFGKTTYLT